MAGNLASPVIISVARPRAVGVTNREMVRPALIPGEFVPIEDAAGRQGGYRGELTGFLVGGLADPPAHRTCLSAYSLKDRGAIVDEGAMAMVLVGAPPWRIFWRGLALTCCRKREQPRRQSGAVLCSARALHLRTALAPL